jgi:hypothetical protein
MFRLTMLFFSGMFFSFASAASAQAPNRSLHSLLDELKARATSAQYAMFADAVGASPALTNQLNDLASSGLLTAFRIDDGMPPPGRGRPFSARLDGSAWVFTSAFVLQQAKVRLYDVVQPDDVLADNMVFALGHLAFKASTAASVLASEQSLQAQFRASQQAGRGTLSSMTADTFIRASVQTHTQDDAGAFIQAWDDTLDAAVRENGGRELSIRQVSSMLMNLRYRAVFMKAMRSADHKLLFAGNGYLKPDQVNRDAIAAALKTMPVYDLQ